MATKFGFSGLSNLTSDKSTGGESPQEIIRGRVKSVVLDNSDPTLFNRLGGWQSIGAVQYDGVSNPSSGTEQSNTIGVAYPLFPNLKFYPLVGEIVTILKLPTKNVDENPTDTRNYYLPPVNIWSSIHHNAIPSYVSPPDSQQVSYQQAEQGTPSSIPDQESLISLGNTFVEKDDIRPLLPYEGDHIMEGRFGNSIRMGSTVKNASIPNKWSTEGQNGDPLLILRNGQTNYTDIPGWQHITEDVNLDKSSIYLTSTQQLPFFPSSNIRNSFKNNDVKPTDTNQYTQNQILLNSGRLTLNATSDSIVMSSPKVIHLSAEESVHLDTKSKIVLSANKVYLGDREATERVVLGDALLQELLLLVITLEGLAEACNTAVAGPFPVASLNTIGGNLKATCADLRKVLQKKNSPLLSKNVYIT